MCVEEGGDGRLLEEVLAQSFISSCIRLLFLFISLCRVLREQTFFLVSSSIELCFSLKAYISILLSSITAFSLFSTLSWGWMKVSLQPGTQCINHSSIGKADGEAVQWVMPLGGSTPDSPRRSDLRPVRTRKVVGPTSEKVSADHCLESSCFAFCAALSFVLILMVVKCLRTTSAPDFVAQFSPHQSHLDT